MAAKPPDAFLSYTRFDDQHDGGKISEFCRRLASAVRAVTGVPFEIFQDVEGIGVGEHWPGKLDEMLNEARFFIPVVTPSYFTSKPCRQELGKFLRAEAERERNDLVLPIYYIECDALEDDGRRAADPLASTLHERQRQDWRELRFESFDAGNVRRTLEQLAREIVKARRRPMPDKAERERAEAERGAREGKARQRAEEEAARSRAAEEQRRGAEEAASTRQKEEEARERAAQEKRRKAEGEARRPRAAEQSASAPFKPDVFLSYASEDKASARELAAALGQRGFSVFWDHEVPPSETWHSHIRQALGDARCVVVVWSRHSIVSEWVIDEAEEGRRRMILIPVLFEAVEPPFGFRNIQVASLIDWHPGRPSPGFDNLLGAVRRIVGGQSGFGNQG